MTEQYLDEAKSPIQQQEHGGQIDLKRTKMLVVVHTIVFCLTMIIQRAVRILKLVNSAPKPFHINRIRASAPRGQYRENLPPSAQVASQGQPFVYQGTHIQHATRLMPKVCVLRHLPANTHDTAPQLGRASSKTETPAAQMLTRE